MKIEMGREGEERQGTGEMRRGETREREEK